VKLTRSHECNVKSANNQEKYFHEESEASRPALACPLAGRVLRYTHAPPLSPSSIGTRSRWQVHLLLLLPLK